MDVKMNEGVSHGVILVVRKILAAVPRILGPGVSAAVRGDS